MRTVLLCLCFGTLSAACVRAQEGAAKPLTVATENAAVETLTVSHLFANHKNIQAVSGTFRDTVTRLGDEEEAQENVLNVTFWLERPNRYHFRVQENSSEDRQHYLSDGVNRWEVEVVLDTEIVDKKSASAEDPFARIQQLMNLDEHGLAEDFQWADVVAKEEVKEFTEMALPEAWQQLLVLMPHSPKMRSEVKRVVLAFSQAGELKGLLINDSRDNRRLVEELEFIQQDALDPALFRWGNE